MIKSFCKKWIFKRIEIINITKSYYIFILEKTQQGIPSFSDYKELNKTNNLKNDEKLINSWKEKKQMSFPIVHKLLAQYFRSNGWVVH